MAGIERGPQTAGLGPQKASDKDAEGGVPFEETQDAERLAKLPEHERDAEDRPLEGGLAGGAAPGVVAGAAGVGDYAGRLNVPVPVKDEELAEQEARERETEKDVTDRRG